ncbi:thermonuclease family protein [Candidatus Methylopumilus planktonicus]|uniref:thermonuclease family protein n=1 Tax=Candidatus Methylopumilus planktonicus TaxID=1581557 RepID=UPI00111D7D3E|nr:thermonuclease family protein [Candidatus Methylopumilus planktonicus]QDD00513.1 thermonuclease family protein [Candidatus Methylopumilus planktonicus]
MKKLICILLLLLSLLSFAEELTGKVINVSDGDTITVLDSNNQKYKIRLQGIDAPETQQAFGETSRQSLASLIYDKEVIILWDKRDKYARILGKVIVDGRDANYEQLKKGLAWYYKQYENDLSDEDKERYAEAEAWARNYTEGLWTDSKSIPPWEFRHKRKN